MTKHAPKAALVILAFVGAAIAFAARCTTSMEPRALDEYNRYVAGVERTMAARLTGDELAWTPGPDRQEAFRNLESGKSVRRNISPEATNQRIAGWNGTVIHWIGAVRIKDTSLDTLKSVLKDYAHCAAIYHPLMYDCRAQSVAVPAGEAYDITYGYQNVFRLASLFPQHYAFQVKSRTDYAEAGSTAGPLLFVHSRSNEIRESDSGTPGRNDFLKAFQDHGILWALNTYWSARPKGRDLYAEFEGITLARSLQDFKCKVGILPVPKSIVYKVMDSLPGESVELMLDATRAECERQSARSRAR